MKIGNRHFRSLWLNADGRSLDVIDQTRLPHEFVVATLSSVQEVAEAILRMVVRGAPLIGASAAYGMALATRADATDASLIRAAALLTATRPTAVNLRWAVDRMQHALIEVAMDRRAELAYHLAAQLCEEDVCQNEALGVAGSTLLRALAAKKSNAPLNVLTHCNAGWLATVDWGTALAPIYKAHDLGVKLHVWVDETRPRNQGAALTAYELAAHGVPFTLIVDNAGGHLMQAGEVDVCIVGADRVAADGAVCNKIGTYLKALAAHDNGIGFYVALPSPSIDWGQASGAAIPIEERSAREVTHVRGLLANGQIDEVALAPIGSQVRNPAFDVTPARLITGFITERGLAKPGAQGLRELFPEAP